MKICAIICEYNPLHNGHAYHIAEAKRLTGADAVVCIMSGNFVQRGEAAIMGKYTRAKHAVLAGADAVVELPSVFATSPAELFAKGGVLLADALGAEFLCFGCESGSVQDFMRAGEVFSIETKELSSKIKAELERGVSLAKARELATKGLFEDEFLTKPNNVLGVEYAKAVYKMKSNIRLVPIQRIGAGYHDESLSAPFPSATAIRTAIAQNENIADAVPVFVKNDVPTTLQNSLLQIEKAALLMKSKAEIQSVCDCTEGLENALVREALKGEGDVAKAITSKRYTTSRIRRILLQNALGIDEKLIKKALKNRLYLSLLSIKKQNKQLLSELGNKKFPLLVRGTDENELSDVAKLVLEKDKFAASLHALIFDKELEEKRIFI